MTLPPGHSLKRSAKGGPRDAMRSVPTAFKAAVACTVPLLACSTYYTLERVGDASPALYFAAASALPVMLLALAGVTARVAAGRTRGPLLWLCSLGVVLPALFLAAVWFRA